VNRVQGSQDACNQHIVKKVIQQESVRGWSGDHLASLGSNNLSASVLRSLGQLVGLLITQLCMWAGLGEQGQDGDASVSTNDRNIYIRNVQALLLGIEGLGPDLQDPNCSCPVACGIKTIGVDLYSTLRQSCTELVV
jgi:hypothetical protein